MASNDDHYFVGEASLGDDVHVCIDADNELELTSGPARIIWINREVWKNLVKFVNEHWKEQE